jgi:hypothetical protein
MRARSRGKIGRCFLPGVSHAGKSTLVAELVRSGATYYSDEFAILDCHGRVHPFARDLRMRHPGRPDQTPLPLSDLNGRAGEKPLPVAMVVFAEFREHACWTPEPVSPGNAVLEMLLHTAPVQRSACACSCDAHRNDAPCHGLAFAARRSRGRSPITPRRSGHRRSARMRPEMRPGMQSLLDLLRGEANIR